MLLTIAITVALIFLALSGMPIFAVIAATALLSCSSTLTSHTCLP